MDDHDYGCDNGDRTYEHKYESGLAYVDFLGLPSDSAMRQRAEQGQGVYGVMLFDFERTDAPVVPEQQAGLDPDLPQPISPPTLSNRTVAVFVLDIRTHKTPWKQGTQAYQRDWEGDYLGETQWLWFEEAIRKSPAQVNVVVQGLQVLGSRFPNGHLAEDWVKYPNAQARLRDALLEARGVPLLVSGDVHMAQLMRQDCRHRLSGLTLPLVEMTTSGMTHSWGTVHNRLVADPDKAYSWYELYDSMLRRTLMTIYHTVMPWNDLMVSSKDGSHEFGGGDGGKQGLQYSLQKNFGELEFDWEARLVTMRAWGEDSSETPLLMAQQSMDARLSAQTRLWEGAELGRLEFTSEATW
eukprot:CAMPEP_0117058234 /NCGR_PEP_ID=MMETSP0472-20121206/40454_1 /TAXON_ID=693140 ORGANISM="Tiarina fusus, Strain LIS" /NCGR_SAMPLE_ID=MMETSP0472 /ASSEMBLY_ACC=CAM_ASM_000603 /LENGTH=352 /DNA_ID=CAMNT_0004775479 /DNA_START=478 /DNA_END=1533 /DNA_ORIENTATION=-